MLVVNTDRDTLVLTRQFRFAAWERGAGTPRGWILEIPAGTVAADGDPESVARSEVAEEVGYRAPKLTRIASFFASPGTTSERVILFEADVTDAHRIEHGGGGLAHEHEYIEIVEVPVAEARARLEAGFGGVACCGARPTHPASGCLAPMRTHPCGARSDS